ncbi:MAG: hypothetical protein EPN86_06595 [Nanoarchaeota archaeon]|nr:MAG: hypothetical protein EPN86_06595 [Nanoarchaeota archaeon]
MGIEDSLTEADDGLGSKVGGFFRDARNSIVDLSDVYFRPKGFEHGGRLYEHLGVRQIKRLITYLPKKYFGKSEYLNNHFIGPKLTIDSLKQYEGYTRANEAIHLGWMILTSAPSLSICFTIDGGPEYKISAALVTAFNLGANFYLASIQRYNRARIYSILDRKLGTA